MYEIIEFLALGLLDIYVGMDTKIIAGLFDGDGTVCLTTTTNGRETISGEIAYPYVVVNIYTTYLPSIREIIKFLGFGKIVKMSLQPGNSKQLWAWSYQCSPSTSTQMVQFLKSIRPFLQEKASRVDVVLDWFAGKISYKDARDKIDEILDYDFPIQPSKEYDYITDENIIEFLDSCAYFTTRTNNPRGKIYEYVMFALEHTNKNLIRQLEQRFGKCSISSGRRKTNLENNKTNQIVLQIKASQYGNDQLKKIILLLSNSSGSKLNKHARAAIDWLDKKISFDELRECLNRKNIPESDVKLSTEYIAGFFDAEGSVGLYKCGDDKNYGVKISVTNCYKPVLERIWSTINVGNFHPSRRETMKNGECKQNWVLAIESKQEARIFLNMIRPYIIEKAEQADIMLDWIDGKIDSKYTEKKLMELKEVQFSDFLEAA